MAEAGHYEPQSGPNPHLIWVIYPPPCSSWIFHPVAFATLTCPIQGELSRILHILSAPRTKLHSNLAPQHCFLRFFIVFEMKILTFYLGIHLLLTTHTQSYVYFYIRKSYCNFRLEKIQSTNAHKCLTNIKDYCNQICFVLTCKISFKLLKTFHNVFFIWNRIK